VTTARTRSDRTTLLLALGALAWLAVQVAYWPVATSFGDEVGYLGEARLLLAGHVRPSPTSPGIWVLGPTGAVGKYPLLLPLLSAPLLALSPPLVFALGIAAALALAWMASRILREHGHDPRWGLLMLAHPTVIIMARTLMVDLLLSAFAVGAWYRLRRGRLMSAAALLALTAAAKPTGVVIAGALIAGEGLRLRLVEGRSGRSALATMAKLSAGVALGGMLAMVLNRVAGGQWWYSYERTEIHTRWFWPTHFPLTAPVHVTSLLLVPPLLILGAIPFWRRREFGPLLAIGSLTTLMCFFFFVDRGRGFVDTLVLSPRLILPSVAFLMIGYLDLLASLVERAPGLDRRLLPLTMVVPSLVCLAIAGRHRGWQAPQAAALAEASRAVAQHHAPELGIAGEASKAAILFRGDVSVATPDNRPKVVLCATASASYRSPGTVSDCRLEGYDDRELTTGFHLLVRRDLSER
jgi:hypothetical protein